MSSASHLETEVEQELRLKCEALDEKKTGIITFAEFKKAFSSLGEEISDKDLEEMVEEAKAGAGEGLLRFAAVIAAMYAE